MPRRLLVAAEIIRDAAATQSAAERSELEALAVELDRHAAAIAGSRGIELQGLTQLETLLGAIRRIAAAVDPEATAATSERSFDQ